MKPLLRLFAIWSVTLALAAAEQVKFPVFEMRLVLDSPAADSEQMVLIHQRGQKNQRVEEALNIAKTPVLDDSAVKSAKVRTGVVKGKPQVEISFTEQGRNRFAEVTKANLNKRLAILVDGKVLSAPVIRAEITGGQAVITGDFSEKEAKELADKINKAVRANDKGKLKPWPYGPYDQLRVIERSAPR